MEGRCAVDLKCLVIASVLAVACRAFNIDVSKAFVFTGKDGTGFGTSAEFIETSTGATELYVGAPHSNVKDQTKSGVYYSCKPNLRKPCNEHWSTPQKWDYSPRQCYSRPSEATNRSHITFGEEQELFGQTIAVLNKTALLMCGPMWSDLCYWAYNFIFNIGRCTVVNSKLPGAEGYTPYRERPTINYQKNIDIGYGLQKDNYYGRAEFGFSAASDGKGRAVFGAPGFSASRGGVAVLDASMNFEILTDIFNPAPETYLGYAVAVGNFCGPTRFCFAVSDRSVFGMVMVMELERGSYSVLARINGTQRYASFGYSLGAVDVNGDGWSDLLVGAPMYTATTNDSRSEDEGRVFVHISRGEVQNGKESFNLSLTLNGDSKSFARFGSAISSIGDINQDHFLDIAVGAPLEGDGAGAVYVYLGGPQGVVTPHTQKITGKDFTPPLSSFGYHISQPTTDLSDYQYPDFAVGCPESDSVVFLRTQLIVNANVQIRADPNPVFPDNQCHPSIDKNALRASGCFTVELCFSQNSVSEESIDLDYTLQLDTLVSSETLKRARIAQKSGRTSTTATTLSSTVSVPNRMNQCLTLTAILKEETINRNRFTPVQLHVTFALNTSRYSDLIPVLNKSVINTAVEEVTFKNQCGDDEKCQTDLVLTGSVLHVPDLVNYQTFNVVNRTRRVDLQLQLMNRNEIAYGTRLTTNITGHIAFKTAVDSRANSHFICDPQANVTSVDSGEVLSSVLVCSDWAPLATNETVDITLQFEADSVPLQPQHSDVIFHVEAMPYSPKENPESNVNNNNVKTASPLRIVADLAIEGSSEPGSLHVRKSDAADLLVKHRLYLRNRGPSFLPLSHVNVSIPQRHSSGSDLFKSMEAHNVTIKYEDGRTVSCDLISATGESIGGTNTPAPTTSTQATTTSGAKVATTTRSSDLSSTTPLEDLKTTTNPFGEVKPSRRKRRQAEAEQQKDDNTRDASSERLLKMDCTNYKCTVYKCPLPAIQPAGDAQINITLALTRSALPFSDNVDTLLLVTKTQVAQPDHPLFFPWSTPRESEVQTPIYEVKTGGEEVNIWIIIGGVLGGLLLLLIIGIVAWKLGFFRRKDRAKLMALKRQSGFYDNSNRRSAKSTKSRTSSTGSSTARKSGIE